MHTCTCKLVIQVYGRFKCWRIHDHFSQTKTPSAFSGTMVFLKHRWVMVTYYCRTIVASWIWQLCHICWHCLYIDWLFYSWICIDVLYPAGLMIHRSSFLVSSHHMMFGVANMDLMTMKYLKTSIRRCNYFLHPIWIYCLIQCEMSFIETSCEFGCFTCRSYIRHNVECYQRLSFFFLLGCFSHCSHKLLKLIILYAPVFNSCIHCILTPVGW